MKRIHVWGSLALILIGCAFGVAQEHPAISKTTVSKSPTTVQNRTQKANVDEYIDLIRSNVRQEKAQILGAVMQLSASDAAKFWPIYNEYDAELAKLNKMRSDNILEYANSYGSMTEDKADTLIATAVQYEKDRTELLAKYYPRMKEVIGSIDAARFLQVEHQLLLIIDLQIASNLPLVQEDVKSSSGGKQ